MLGRRTWAGVGSKLGAEEACPSPDRGRRQAGLPHRGISISTPNLSALPAVRVLLWLRHHLTAGQTGLGSLWAESGPGDWRARQPSLLQGNTKLPGPFQFSFIPLPTVPVSFGSPGPRKMLRLQMGTPFIAGLVRAHVRGLFVQIQDPGLGMHSCDDLQSFQLTSQ